MDIKFALAPQFPAHAIALPVSSEKKLSAQHVKLIGSAAAGTLKAVLAAHAVFTGDKDQTLWVHGVTVQKTAHSILLYGTGKPADLTALESQKLGGSLAAQAKAQAVPKLSVLLPDTAHAHDCALGAMLRSYHFADYKTKDKKPAPVKQLTFITAAAKQAQKDWSSHHAIAKGVYLARDLMNQPPNICTPQNFVKTTQAVLKGLPVTITVLDEKAIDRIGMGAMQAVSRGSRHAPRVMIVEYNGLGTAKRKSSRPVALVGKGVTFDTGGYNIKPGVFVGGGMFDMKYDMGGAAAVVGSVLALASAKAAKHVVGIVGLVENLVDEDAYLPGEVVTTLSGQTVEIMDTDAEGRLVLADLLTHVQKTHRPHTIIDIATLTGSAMATFGSEYTALFSNRDDLANQLQQCGLTTGEKCWRLPIDAAPAATLKSSIADFVNVELSRLAGASFAALFLSQFVDANVNWAHLDIAGQMKAKSDLPLCPTGAMGHGVRLMTDYVLRHG